MFKILRDIKAQLEHLNSVNDEAMTFLRRRHLEIEADRAIQKDLEKKPFKCPRPDCEVAHHHVHVIAVTQSIKHSEGSQS